MRPRTTCGRAFPFGRSSISTSAFVVAPDALSSVVLSVDVGVDTSCALTIGLALLELWRHRCGARRSRADFSPSRGGIQCSQRKPGDPAVREAPIPTSPLVLAEDTIRHHRARDRSHCGVGPRSHGQAFWDLLASFSSGALLCGRRCLRSRVNRTPAIGASAESRIGHVLLALTEGVDGVDRSRDPHVPVRTRLVILSMKSRSTRVKADASRRLHQRERYAFAPSCR